LVAVVERVAAAVVVGTVTSVLVQPLVVVAVAVVVVLPAVVVAVATSAARRDVSVPRVVQVVAWVAVLALRAWASQVRAALQALLCTQVVRASQGRCVQRDAVVAVAVVAPSARLQRRTCRWRRRSSLALVVVVVVVTRAPAAVVVAVRCALPPRA
jgi:hypothetical protein